MNICPNGKSVDQCVTFRTKDGELVTKERFKTHRDQPEEFYEGRVNEARAWLLQNNVRVTNEKVRMFGINSKMVNLFYKK